MSAPQAIPSAGRPLSAGAIALMLMLCLTWGFNQIAVKLVLPDIPPMLQATIRSAGALPVLFIIGTLRGVKFFEKDGTWKPGLIAGLMFGIEFVLIFQGLRLTSASRAVVFLYTAPFFVALGSYQVLGERLGASQWLGLAISFAGVALAIGVPQPNVDSHARAARSRNGVAAGLAPLRQQEMAGLQLGASIGRFDRHRAFHFRSSLL